MGGGEDDLVVALKKIGAGRAGRAGADHLLLAGRKVENVDLVALFVAVPGLENQLAAVGGPVGLGVLAAEGELPHVAEVLLLRITLDGATGLDLEGRRRHDGVGSVVGALGSGWVEQAPRRAQAMKRDEDSFAMADMRPITLPFDRWLANVKNA